MEHLFLSLLNNSIAAGFLVLVLALLRLLPLRMSKEWRCLLWELVYLRLLLPGGIQSHLSLVPSAQTIPPEIFSSPRPAVQSGITAVDAAVNPVLQQSLAPAPGGSANPAQIWLGIGGWLWLAGFAALLLYALLSTLLLRRRVAESVPLRDNIRLCSGISSPFVLGLSGRGSISPMGWTGRCRRLFSPMSRRTSSGSTRM